MSRNQLTFGAVTPRVEQARADVDRAHDAEAYDRLLAVVRAICAVRRQKDVAYELDVQPSHLSEALAGGGGKQVQLRWLPTLARLCPDELRAELRATLLDLVDGDAPLTPEEELARLREVVLADFGKAGALAVETARRRRGTRR